MKRLKKSCAHSPRVERKIYAHARTVRRALSWLVIPAVLSASLQAGAADNCKLDLVMTVNNQPAMEPVASRIFRAGSEIAVSRRHSYSITLPCGDGYTVAATKGGNTRTRTFALHGLAEVAEIIMEMGE